MAPAIEDPAKNPMVARDPCLPMHDRDLKAKYKPIGPFAPPLPTEVEDTPEEPMAVANDKATIHGESFLPTSAPMDQYDEEVARRYKQVPGAQMKPHGNAETVAMESPPGYTEPNKRGWAKLEAQQDEETEP